MPEGSERAGVEFLSLTARQGSDRTAVSGMSVTGLYLLKMEKQNPLFYHGEIVNSESLNTLRERTFHVAMQVLCEDVDNTQRASFVQLFPAWFAIILGER